MGSIIFRTRDDLPLILNEMGLNGTWVEVGVERGAYSKVLIEKGNFKKLILIDPWKKEDWFKNVDQETLDLYFREVCELQKDPRVTVLRSTSLEMAKIVEERLDFVYHDAKHDFNSVSEDSRAWWPKIRPGGVYAGHDYSMQDVKDAVCLFSIDIAKKTINIASEESAQSWYLIK